MQLNLGRSAPLLPRRSEEWDVKNGSDKEIKIAVTYREMYDKFKCSDVVSLQPRSFWLTLQGGVTHTVSIALAAEQWGEGDGWYTAKMAQAMQSRRTKALMAKPRPKAYHCREPSMVYRHQAMTSPVCNLPCSGTGSPKGVSYRALEVFLQSFRWRMNLDTVTLGLPGTSSMTLGSSA